MDPWILLIENDEAHASIASRAIKQLHPRLTVRRFATAEEGLGTLHRIHQESLSDWPLVVLLSASALVGDAVHHLRRLAEHRVTDRSEIVLLAKSEGGMLEIPAPELGIRGRIHPVSTLEGWIDQFHAIESIRRFLYGT
ncbi:MAG: hypothetical protein RIB32_03280 [Phycisphaerales bacterium]